MDVTLVGGEFPPMQGGVGDYTRELAREFARRGLRVVERLTRDQPVVHIQYQAAAYGMTAPIHLLPQYLRWRKPARRVLVTLHDLKVPYLFPKAGALRRHAVL